MTFVVVEDEELKYNNEEGEGEGEVEEMEGEEEYKPQVPVKTEK